MSRWFYPFVALDISCFIPHSRKRYKMHEENGTVISVVPAAIGVEPILTNIHFLSFQIHVFLFSFAVPAI